MTHFSEFKNPPLFHSESILPNASDIELGRGVDGIVIEVQDYPEWVIKTMHHPFKLGMNRIKLEQRVLSAVAEQTNNLGSTRVFNSGIHGNHQHWLVRERVFDVFPRGSQADRDELIDLIFSIHPMADVNRLMLPDPTFDNVRWGYTRAHTEPRWILIDP